MVEAVSEVFAVCWSHSPGGSFSGSPSMASAEMALFLLLKHIREKKKFFYKMQEEDLRCS